MKGSDNNKAIGCLIWSLTILVVIIIICVAVGAIMAYNLYSDYLPFYHELATELEDIFSK